MDIRRTARRHTAGVVSEDYADFAVGQHVMTIDGFPGVVTAVEDGPYPGTETYQVVLDAEMGGGTYSTSDLKAIEATTAATVTPYEQAKQDFAAAVMAEFHQVMDDQGVAVASADYPELAEILLARPPLAHAEPLHMRASKTAASFPQRPRCKCGHSDMSHTSERTGTSGSGKCGTCACTEFRKREPKPSKTAAGDNGCTACGGTGEQGTGHECYICDGTGDSKAEAEGRADGITNENLDSNLMVGRDDAKGIKPVTGAAYYLQTPESNALYEAAGDVLGAASRAMAVVDVPDESIENGTAEALALAQRPDLAALDAEAAKTDWAALHDILYCDKCGFQGPVPPVTDLATGQLVDVCPQCGDKSPYEEIDANGWALDDPMRPANQVAASKIENAADEHVFFATAGLWDKVLNAGTDVLNSQMKPEYQYVPGESHTYDWCRFRHNERCMFPKHLDEVGTKAAGYPVWIPEDRGRCPRNKWDEQKACPVSQPGPHSGEPGAKVDATIPWNEGGQHGGLPTTATLIKSAGFEFTASWSDVRAKAKRIRSEGGVRIISAPTPGDETLTLSAEVKGDTHVYETTLLREPGRQNVASWRCGCAWAAYSWGRSPAYKRYEGRMCSHALALQYEAQAQGMFGRTVVEQATEPPWRVGNDPFTYVKPEPGYTRAASRTRPVYTDPELAEAPITAIARMEKQASTGVQVLVRGTIKVLKAIFVSDAHAMGAFTDGSSAALDEILYPTYDPVKGLTWDSRYASLDPHLAEALAFEDDQGLAPYQASAESRFLTLDQARAAADGGAAADINLGINGVPVADWATAEKHDEPEPALPTTDGAEDDLEDLHAEAMVVDALADPATAPELAEAVTASLVTDPPVPGDPRLAYLMSDAPAAASTGSAANPSDGDIAAQAKAYLAKSALKSFSPEEQREIIEEGLDVQAANLADLDITGTHYEGLEAAFAAAEEDDEL